MKIVYHLHDLDNTCACLLLPCKVQYIAVRLHQLLEQGLWVLNSVFRKYQKLNIILFIMKMKNQS